MNDYVIIVDSTIDLGVDQINELDVTIVPLRFCFGDQEYTQYADGREMSTEEFFARIKAGENASTNQATASDFMDAAEPFLKEGKDVLIIPFSSKLSGTYQSSVIAAAELNEKYPNNKTIAIDTKSASGGYGLLVYCVVKMKREGKTIDEIADWVRAHQLNFCHWVTIGDLGHLKRGGRISAASAMFGTLLGVKPIIIMDNEGSLVPIGKVRGRIQSLDNLVDEMEKSIDRSLCDMVFINHSECLGDAQYIKEQVKARIGIKGHNIIINPLGPVIGAHTGCGCVALFFTGCQRTSMK